MSIGGAYGEIVQQGGGDPLSTALGVLGPNLALNIANNVDLAGLGMTAVVINGGITYDDATGQWTLPAGERVFLVKAIIGASSDATTAADVLAIGWFDNIPWVAGENNVLCRYQNRVVGGPYEHFDGINPVAACIVTTPASMPAIVKLRTMNYTVGAIDLDSVIVEIKEL